MYRLYTTVYSRLLSSARYATLKDDGSRVFFTHLLLAVDAWGRITANAITLDARVWPSLKRSFDALGAAVADCQALGMIDLYEEDGRRWIQVTEWETFAGRHTPPEKRGPSDYPNPTAATRLDHAELLRSPPEHSRAIRTTPASRARAQKRLEEIESREDLSGAGVLKTPRDAEGGAAAAPRVSRTCGEPGVAGVVVATFLELHAALARDAHGKPIKYGALTGADRKAVQRFCEQRADEASDEDLLRERFTAMLTSRAAFWLENRTIRMALSRWTDLASITLADDARAGATRAAGERHEGMAAILAAQDKDKAHANDDTGRHLEGPHPARREVAALQNDRGGSEAVPAGGALVPARERAPRRGRARDDIEGHADAGRPRGRGAAQGQRADAGPAQPLGADAGADESGSA